MTPQHRERVERNMEYHQQLANHYAKTVEEGDREREGVQRSEAQQAEHQRVMEEANQLAEMHADAAQQLRDVLGTEVDPAIAEAATKRPVIRRLS